MKKHLMLAIALVAVAAVPRASHAQIGVTPQIGVYIPGNDFHSIRAGADSIRAKSEGALALGLNVDFGMLRGSVAYASAAKLVRSCPSCAPGVEGEVGEGKLLAAAVDVVLRPIPRLLVLQPYLLIGGGLRRADYDFDTDALSNAFPENDSDFAVHAGVGADVMLGGLGISAEITDFISKNTQDEWKRHDAFGFVGLKLKL
jgi:hypothetical protein